MPLSPCARGCCWTQWQVCSRASECACHWGDWLLTAPADGSHTPPYRDPTAGEAIYNISKERGQR